jgi:hypothetical protein
MLKALNAQPAVILFKKCNEVVTHASDVNRLLFTAVTKNRLISAAISHKVRWSYPFLASDTSEDEHVLMPLLDIVLLFCSCFVLVCDLGNLFFAERAFALCVIHPLFNAYKVVNMIAVVQLGI